MNTKVFREYDIRGVYGPDINEQFAYKIGRSYATYIKEKFNANTVIVGRDNRLSSPNLANSLILGLTDSGADVINLGLVASPMCAYATKKCHNVFSIMITASHNPKEDNGFKFSFDKYGMAGGDKVYEFRDFTLKGDFISGYGKIKNFDITPYYVNHAISTISLKKKLKVVLDPANGTASPFLKIIFDKLNIDYKIIYGESNGNFPNHHPDPSIATNLEDLKQEVLKNNADLGIGYDGDADRLGVIDNLGNFIPADQLMILFARELIKKSDNKKILYDVKSSKALEDEIVKNGGIPICYRVGGHSYIRSKVNKDNIILGGELSGHIVFNDKWPGIDDGLYASLRLIELLSNSEKQLNELLSDIPKYYNTPEIKVKTTDDKKFKIVEEIKERCLKNNLKINDIDGVRVEYPDGWALIRASNTGPNLTLRFEASSKERLEILKSEYQTIVDELN